MALSADPAYFLYLYTFTIGLVYVINEFLLKQNTLWYVDISYLHVSDSLSNADWGLRLDRPFGLIIFISPSLLLRECSKWIWNTNKEQIGHFFSSCLRKLYYYFL